MPLSGQVTTVNLKDHLASEKKKQKEEEQKRLAEEQKRMEEEQKRMEEEKEADKMME